MTDETVSTGPNEGRLEGPSEEPLVDEAIVELPYDPGLTGSIEALEVADEERDVPEAALEDGDAQTAVIPSADQLSDEQAAAMAFATLPASHELVGPEALVDAETANAVAGIDAPEGIDMGPDKPSRWWLWTLIVILLLAIAGSVGYAWWWTTSRPIRVPDVVGKQAGEATQIFNDVSLRLGDVSEVATDAAPQGTILSQNPEAGTELKPSGRVSFVVALPPVQTQVPEIGGRLSEEAQTELAKARLRPLLVESFATTVAAGYVVSQLPTTGVELPPGSPVVLVVSRGPVPSTVSVPRVAGLTEADMSTLLTASNLKPLIYRAYDASITAGTVITQSPAAGLAAPYDSFVQVLVSQGAGTGTVEIPNVVGQTRASAAKAIKGKKLKAESRTVSHPTIPKGQVIYQMPPSGKKVVSGTTIGLLVSRGNLAEATVPSLVGTMSAGVPEAITKAGFSPVVVNVPALQYATDTVFMQFPAGGTPLTQGLPVVCLVSSQVP